MQKVNIEINQLDFEEIEDLEILGEPTGVDWEHVSSVDFSIKNDNFEFSIKTGERIPWEIDSNLMKIAENFSTASREEKIKLIFAEIDNSYFDIHDFVYCEDGEIGEYCEKLIKEDIKLFLNRYGLGFYIGRFLDAKTSNSLIKPLATNVNFIEMDTSNGIEDEMQIEEYEENWLPCITDDSCSIISIEIGNVNEKYDIHKITSHIDNKPSNDITYCLVPKDSHL